MNQIYNLKYSARNNIKYLLFLILVINPFIISFLYDELYISKFNSANITLKIKGIGNHKIFYEFYNTNSYPNEVKINGIKQDNVNASYYFDKSDNFIELYWDHNNIKGNCMFRGCNDIYEIKFLNFDTSKVTSMGLMFYHYTLLTSLDLSKFDTSNVEDISYMFSHCLLLTSLNLSNFDTSKVTNMDDMFDGCSNLNYINLQNFGEIKLNQWRHIFDNVPINFFVCGNESSLNSQFKYQITGCYTIDCSDDWPQKQKKIIYGTKTCIDSCQNEALHNYEYNGQCYENCSRGYETYNNIKYCKCELEKCRICTPVALKLNLCNKCNDNYYPKENDDLNYGDYIECYNETIGYYLDQINSIFKKCYNTCYTCEIEGNFENHNCLICNKDTPYGINISNYFNCYIKCQYYYYFDNKNYRCTLDKSCPVEYPILIDELECIKNDIKHIQYNITKIGKNDTLILQEDDEIKYYDLILNITETIFTSYNYDTSKIDEGGNEIINIDKINIAFRTTQTSKNDTNKNLTKIDLGECETLLRNHYNISEFLYIKQIEVEQEGMKIKKIEYEVYSKLSQSKLTKLDLSICNNTKIIISVPIIITEDLDKLNISSGYYNDVCYVTLSDSGTDITLKDRKEGYKTGNKIICQDECDFSGYNYDAQEAICSCNVKELSSSFSKMKINKGKIYEKFIDINTIANIKIIICYKVLFTIKGLIYNIPFYSIIIMIIFHFLTIFIFYYIQIKLIKNKIQDIVFGINNWNLVKVFEKEKRKLEKDNYKNKKMSKILPTEKDINLNNIQTQKINIKFKKTKKFIIKLPTPLDYYFLDKILNKKNPPIKTKKELKQNNNNIIIKNSSSNQIINDKSTNNKEIVLKVKEIMFYNDEEMNNLSYKLALKFDKRTFCSYYLSLIRTKHVLIFSFYYNKKDYNSQIIKINLFFVGFITDLFINALFFNDDTMHKIYEEEGDFNFLYQLPQIIYSTLISLVINNLIQMLALSEGNILDFKKNKNKKNLNKRVDKLNNILRIKFILYFIICIILLIFFWYYLSMFCAVYRNTQNHLIKDTLISFGLSIIYPFGIYLLPGIFRIPSLSNSDNKRNCMYNLSLILQML